MAAGVVTRPSRRSADEDRLSTKAVPRGKEKIVEPTANAAQEMHRISTGATRVSFRRGTRPALHSCRAKGFKAEGSCRARAETRRFPEDRFPETGGPFRPG